MIQYESASKVSASAIRKMLADIGSMDRVWWRGALGLDADPEAQQPAVVGGKTALFHAHGIPDPDDLFMAFADAVFILERLRDWARRFSVKWHLRMNDEEWGSVDPTGYSKDLRGELEKWSRRAGAAPSGKDRWTISLERRAELLRRHSGRH